MAQIVMQLSDELADKLQPLQRWLPTLLQLSLLGFKTRAATAVGEVTSLLKSNPTPQEVLEYHISDAAQVRLQRLLALNEAGLLGEEEQAELDELQQLEHLVVMLKGQILAQQS